MKFKIVGGALSWLIVVTILHVTLNIGWARLAHKIEIRFTGERPELVVGFLPVT